MEGIMSFKQQNNGTLQTAVNRQIEKLILTNIETPINTACALLNDHKTLQQLYVSKNSDLNRQAHI